MARTSPIPTLASVGLTRLVVLLPDPCILATLCDRECYNGSIDCLPGLSLLHSYRKPTTLHKMWTVTFQTIPVGML
ncbi:hypothetical protein BJ170DRAFT_329100 [Xylariales sp. AK1849]|nr:hypothetical protein BJ170DRAFT_329100 [Xylariales sp. AK1849]